MDLRKRHSGSHYNDPSAVYVSDSVVHKDNVASKAKELILDLG